MRSKQKKRSCVRSFERDIRIQRLVEAGIIKAADEIPADAVPASVEYAHRTPYYRDTGFRCEDCGSEALWTADDQRYWYEQLRGSPYSTAKRCTECRRKRRGGRNR